MTQAMRNGTPKIVPHPHLQALYKRLDTLVTQQPALHEISHFYRAALPIVWAAQQTIEPFTLMPSVVQQKLQAGLPLLVGEALPLDEDQLCSLFIQLCRVVEELDGDLAGSLANKNNQGTVGRVLLTFFKRGEPDAVKLLDRVQNGDGASLRVAAAQQLRQAVEQARLDLGEVWVALLAGDEDRLEQVAGTANLDGALLHTLGQHTLRPALQRWAADLKPLADFDNAWFAGVWQRVGCPICGGAPRLGEIAGKEGARRLRCSGCGLGWGYPRLFCAHCGNQAHRKMGYLSAEGEEEKYRVQTCELCQGYLKIIVTFDPIPVNQLPIEDLATVHLDAIATQHGFMGASVIR
jgi:formate dehydrogenase accessory protein FdhE